MKFKRRVITHYAILAAVLIAALPKLVAAQDETNPVKEKFQQDLKAAVMDQSITVPQLKEIMATVKQPARDTLRQDFQLMMATKQPAPSTEPDTPGKKLGKDVFAAVMHGEPTPAQVQQLQDSLRSLQTVKGSGEGLLQQFRTLKAAKAQIAQIINAGSFRPQDKQTVLDDLDNLGPKGGGGGLRRNG